MNTFSPATYSSASPGHRTLGLPPIVTRSLLGLLAGGSLLLGSNVAFAQSCTLNTTTDWMTSLISKDAFAQQIAPQDCLVVDQTPPDFRWPEASTSATYSVTLRYPNGSQRTLSAPRNWINWDQTLAPGTYTWRVSHSGGTSQYRTFIVPGTAKPFLVPTTSALISKTVGKSHPRSLPDATTLTTMKNQRQAAITALLAESTGLINKSLPSAGAGTSDGFNYSRQALTTLLACVFTNQDSHCNEASRRVRNLAAWDPNGATGYLKSTMDVAAARYLAWTIATGYDWLYPRLTSSQRTQVLSSVRTRTNAMYNDLIGTRSKLGKAPRDAHGHQGLNFIAVISTLVVGDLSDASNWLSNSLPFVLNATSPWGEEEGGFSNATARGNWAVGELLPLWIQLRYATGVDIAQKGWVRNWGRYFTYFTPPGTPDGTTVFGNAFEVDESEHQARYGKGYFHFAPSPLGRWHAGRLSGEEQERIEYLLSPPADFTGSPPFPAGTPNALALTALGEVAMHSDLSTPGRTSVYFKSSPPPFGAFDHGHADQNSFVINAGGERLAIESGYYDSFKSAHWTDWYHTTKAKNAITYDGGKGQLHYTVGGKMGYGKITRFTTSTGHDIVTGDATQAYGGALSRAERSLVYLRPNLLLVYDNLASSTSRQWEWNIHALNQMAASSDTQVTIQSGSQKLCITQLAGPGTKFTQTSQFSTSPSGSRPQQWHGRFTSASRTTTAEFVTLLNIGCSTVTASAKKTSGVWSVPIGDRTVSITSSSGAISVAAATTSEPAPAPTPAPAPEPEPTPTPVPAPAPAPAPSPTVTPDPNLPTTGTKAVATFESLGLYWKPPSNPGTAGCQIRYRKVGEEAWKEGLPMWYDSRNGECRGSLVYLTPGSTYTVLFAMPGQQPVAKVQATTWSNTFPIAKTVTVSSRSQTLAITEGGSASGYVLYTAPSGGATIDGGNTQTYNVTISAPYVILRGFTLKGARQDAIRLLKGARDVVIEDNDISGWGRLKGSSSEGNLGVNYDSAVGAHCSGDLSMQRIIVQRNYIHDPRYTANSWSLGHPEGPQGITLQTCGGNHVFRYNEIIGGSSGNYYNDAIGGCCNFTNTGFPLSDTDIYGNLIRNTWDDAIEAEGANTNVRIWGNYIDSTTLGVATTVVAVGPVYIFRNVQNRMKQLKAVTPDKDTRNGFAKSGTQSSTIGGGKRYLFHNTLLQATQSGQTYPLGAGEGIAPAGLTITSTMSRNNIFHIWKDSAYVIRSPGSGNDFGYDLYNGNLGGATNVNGIKGKPVYASGNGWQSEANGMYQLAPSSPGYDKGQRIPNFNDNFKGTAPDMGAHEAGAPAMVFGRKAATSPAPAP